MLYILVEDNRVCNKLKKIYGQDNILLKNFI